MRSRCCQPTSRRTRTTTRGSSGKRIWRRGSVTSTSSAFTTVGKLTAQLIATELGLDDTQFNQKDSRARVNNQRALWQLDTQGIYDLEAGRAERESAASTIVAAGRTKEVTR